MQASENLPSESLDQERRTFDEFTPFWDVYNAEAESYDKELIREWAGDLDALLIFAGLFAGVNTAFIIESYKKLQEDPMDTNNLILRHILHRLDNSTFTAEQLQFTTFGPSNVHVRVNGLFFASLSFSLSAAFGAVLAKQWLNQYEGGISRVRRPSDRARIRHEKLRGLRKWYLKPVVETLPTLLQISLFLFLMGLIDFLWIIHTTIAQVVLVISVILFLFYSSTTLISIFSASAPFQTRFSASLRRLLHKVRPSRQPSHDGEDLFKDDELREECVVWVLQSATLPTTIRTVCKAISMLPHSYASKTEGLRDWNVITRYLRAIIANGAVLADVPNATLPSALEVLFQLISNSATSPTTRDSNLVSKELITVLPERLHTEPASSAWILKILGTIYSTDGSIFREMIGRLHQAIGRAGIGNQDADSGVIIDQFLIFLKRAVHLNDLGLVLKISDMLTKIVESCPPEFELLQEMDLYIFVTLLEAPIFSNTTTPSDRTSFLNLSSALIKGVIRHRVERSKINNQNPLTSAANVVKSDELFRSTLDVLQRLLQNHGLKNDIWELDLLALFRSSLADIETSARIIQVLGVLIPALPFIGFDEYDVNVLRTFLTHSSMINSDIDWSSALLILYCACNRNALEAVNVLTSSGISEDDLGNLFLKADSTSYTELQSIARLEMGCKWLQRQGESFHSLFRTNNWSKDLLRCSGSKFKDVYLKAVKDVLSCSPSFWYGQLVKDGHLDALCQIIRASNDDKGCDWVGCFLFMALWRWHWIEATKVEVNLLPFLEADIVQGIVHFFTSSHHRTTHWNAEHFGAHLESVTSLRETVLSAGSYLQAAASADLVETERAGALQDGYRLWVSSISEYLAESRVVDPQLWNWAHDVDHSLFGALSLALAGHEGDPSRPQMSGMSSQACYQISIIPSSPPQMTALSTPTYYLIHSIQSGNVIQCSSASDDTGLERLVVNYRDLNALNQKWKFIPASPGAFLIQNAATGTYLTYQKLSPQANQARLEDGSAYIVSLSTSPAYRAKACCHPIPSAWELRQLGLTDKVRFVLRDFPTLALDVPHHNPQEGDCLVVFELHDLTFQQFTLEAVEI